MKITSVRSFLMSYPLPEPLKLSFYGGERTIVKRDAMLIRVETDKGLIGYAPGPGSEIAHRAIESTIAPFLEGRLLADPDALRIQFFDQPACGPETRKTYCAVEVALYDLASQAQGIPMSELLGGRVRDRIRLYGSAGMYMDPVRYAEEAAGVAELGFQAYKMRPGRGPEQDLEAVRLMRKAVGPDFELMIDAHTWWRMGDKSYTADTVEQMAKDLAAHDAAWLEEPLPRRSRSLSPVKRKRLSPHRQRRARAERRSLPRSDPVKRRRLRANGRLLPGRLHHGPPHLLGNRARRTEIRLP